MDELEAAVLTLQYRTAALLHLCIPSNWVDAIEAATFWPHAKTAALLHLCTPPNYNRVDVQFISGSLPATQAYKVSSQPGWWLGATVAR